ncbi:hypothetical protein EVAR_6791_1 [Eumeta japonica]|uniref:Uncharacterized protein n=1 Tax=Eumeta variegata TaxID=151549 RepID=A0A4C1U689_EUMVA|nr:hypothetical protein EVAR_6791_1 [Eumeta japonica]
MILNPSFMIDLILDINYNSTVCDEFNFILNSSSNSFITLDSDPSPNLHCDANSTLKPYFAVNLIPALNSDPNSNLHWDANFTLKTDSAIDLIPALNSNPNSNLH